MKSLPGTAPGVAAAVDAAALPEVVGSVAGNDTMLVVSQDDETATTLVNLFNTVRASREER